MKTFLLLLCLLPLSLGATTHVVTNSGYTFSPTSVDAVQGDTVSFVLASIHNAREVSQSTWDANGSASNGGFETAFGGGKVVLTSPGTFYYVCANHYYMGMKGTLIVSPATGVGDQPAATPSAFTLTPNFPNPFNPSTSFSATLPVRSRVTIGVYDVAGEQVAKIFSGTLEAGTKRFSWNAAHAASGIYFCRMEAEPAGNPDRVFTRTIRMILAK